MSAAANNLSPSSNLQNFTGEEKKKSNGIFPALATGTLVGLGTYALLPADIKARQVINADKFELTVKDATNADRAIAEEIRNKLIFRKEFIKEAKEGLTVELEKSFINGDVSKEELTKVSIERMEKGTLKEIEGYLAQLKDKPKIKSGPKALIYGAVAAAVVFVAAKLMGGGKTKEA